MEKIFDYSWGKFINSPFSAILVAVCLALGYLVYTERQNLQQENLKDEAALEKCNENRIKDREEYIKLLEKLKVNNELNK